jgi:hypothetical protein
MVWPSRCSEQIPQGQPALRVQARGRLVEEEHRGAVEDGPRHHEPLRHPAGQGEHRCLGPLGQLELAEQLVGDPARLLGPHAEQPAVEVEVLPDSELAVQGVLLGHDPAELLGQRRVRGDVHPAEVRPAGRRHHPCGQHPGRGCLARAVGAQQAEDLPGADVQVELVDGGEIGAGVNLGQVLGVDDGVAGDLGVTGPADAR